MASIQISDREREILEQIASRGTMATVFEQLSDDDESSIQRFTKAGWVKRTPGGACFITRQGQDVLRSLDVQSPVSEPEHHSHPNIDDRVKNEGGRTGQVVELARRAVPRAEYDSERPTRAIAVTVRWDDDGSLENVDPRLLSVIKS